MLLGPGVNKEDAHLLPPPPLAVQSDMTILIKSRELVGTGDIPANQRILLKQSYRVSSP